jgi:glycosyl transferase family 2
MQKRISLWFAVVMLGLYLILSVPVLVLTTADTFLARLIFTVLNELLVLGIALDLAELTFAFLLPPTRHPIASEIDTLHTRVAVLYVCCDDVDEESLQSLARLGGVDVFILDDSQCPNSRQQLDRSGLKVVRRSGREGFKGGNLNHWLEHYQNRYKYFVVLDSDSIVKAEAIWELVAFAEHPQNRDVAIVQSSIYPRPGNLFQRFNG